MLVEIERRGAVAPAFVLLQPCLKDLLTDECIVTEVVIKRMQSWLHGGKLEKLSVARFSLLAEVERVTKEAANRRAMPDSDDESLVDLYFLHTAMVCLESLVSFAHTGKYEVLQEALSQLEALPADREDYDDAMEASRKSGSPPVYPPTLGDVYDKATAVTALPAKTAQEKVRKIERKLAIV